MVLRHLCFIWMRKENEREKNEKEKYIFYSIVLLRRKVREKKCNYIITCIVLTFYGKTKNSKDKFINSCNNHDKFHFLLNYLRRENFLCGSHYPLLFSPHFSPNLNNRNSPISSFLSFLILLIQIELALHLKEKNLYISGGGQLFLYGAFKPLVLMRKKREKIGKNKIKDKN